MGLQSRQQVCKESGDGFWGDQSDANSQDGSSQQVLGTSVKDFLAVDEGKCKVRLMVDDTNDVRSKPSGGVIKAKDARSSIHDQANARIQQPCCGEGDEVGSVGVFVDSVPREGKNRGEDGIDGMEFEEGNRDLTSSV